MGTQQLSSIEVKAIRREADRLGIPWTLSTAVDELRELVAQRTKRLVMVSHVEERDGKFFVSGQQQPDCFGQLWSAVEPDKVPPADREAVEACNTCESRVACLDHFVVVRLPLVQTQLADKVTVPRLAHLLEVPAEAVLKAMEHQARSRNGAASPVSPQPVHPPAPVAVAPAPLAQQTVPASPVAGQKVEPLRPPKAGASVERAVAPAPKVEKSVKAAKARAVSTQDPDKRVARWQRERDRYPDLAKKGPGSKLSFTYKGADFEVRIQSGGYSFQNKLYTTLYQIACAVTGAREYDKQERNGERPDGTRTMSAWSVSRLFGFQKKAKRKK